jgi:hypothetical protein
MLPIASAFVLTVALTSGAAGPVASPAAFTPLADAIATVAMDAPVGSGQAGPLQGGRSSVPAWMQDGPAKRPAALMAMYASLGALQAMDVYSTRRALAAGGTELNPVMRTSAGHSGAMLAAKAVATAGSVFFTERAWKKNRKGAMVLMAVMNGVTAAVVANNLKNAR